MLVQEMAVGMLIDFSFSFVAFFILQSTITHIFYLGKSRNTVKKLRKQYSFFKRLKLCHVKDGKEDCIRHKKALHVFLLLRNIYMGIFCLTVLIHLLSLMHILTVEVWEQCIKLKWCTIDVAAFIYAFIMTKHDKKHGGCTWRWE